MAINIYCVTNEQYARNGAAVSAYIKFYTYSTLEAFVLGLEQNDNVRFDTVTSSIKDAVKDQFNWLCQAYDNNSNCDYVQSGWTYGLRSCLNFSNLAQSDIDYWNNNFAGRTLEIILRCPVTISGTDYLLEYYRFSKVLPNINSASVILVSDVCCQFSACSSAPFTRNMLGNWTEVKNPQQCFISLSEKSGNVCQDLRTSSGTNECQISLNVLDIDDNQQSNRYTLLFQPDASHTSGQVTNLGMIPFRSILGASAHFTGGVVRDSGLITIRGHIEGYLPGTIIGTDFPTLEFVNEDVVLLQASFEPCCDYPVSYSETYSDKLSELLEGLEDYNYSLQVEVVSIEWSGFGNLTDYCCDNSDCSDDDFVYPPNDTINSGGSSGGGEGGEGGEGSGTDPCVCEWLESIDTKLGLLNNSLSSLLCICSSIDSLTSVLRGKELSVTNQITVTPSTAQITTPVNAPVTVNPPVNQITVNPTPITNTVTPCTPTVTVNPTDLTGLISAINGLQLTASVTNNIDGLTCENSLGQPESLACIIKNALYYDGLSISEIQKKAFSKFDDCCNDDKWLVDGLFTENDVGCLISFADLVKNKEFGSYFDVTVDGNDLVNYRKVFKDPLDNA